MSTSWYNYCSSQIRYRKMLIWFLEYQSFHHNSKAGLHQTRSQTVLARPKIIFKRVGNAWRRPTIGTKCLSRLRRYCVLTQFVTRLSRFHLDYQLVTTFKTWNVGAHPVYTPFTLGHSNHGSGRRCGLVQNGNDVRQRRGTGWVNVIAVDAMPEF